MATNVNKIKSNSVGVRIAEEVTYKVLPGTPIWLPLAPNEFGDSGADMTLLSRNPINESRQRIKGNIVDLDASADMTLDLTMDLQSFFEGAMFARMRRKAEKIVTAVDIDAANPDEYECASTTGFFVGTLSFGENFTNSANNGLHLVTVVTPGVSVEVATGELVTEAPPATAKITNVGHQFAIGDIDVDIAGNFARYTSTVFDFTTLGLIPGEWIYMGGDTAGTQFGTAANNGFKRVFSVAANALVVDKSFLPMVTEANTTSTIRMFYGRVLRNETGTSIVDITYQVERTLGAPDTALPSQVQSEYVTGCYLDELNIDVPTADKMTVQFAFLGADAEQRTGALGVKTGTRPTLADLDCFNTSSDFARIKLGVVSTTVEAPSPLFAYVTDFKISIKNNCKPLKAVSVLGAFDVSPGTFEVSAEMNAYFTDTTGPAAVRANSDMTLDMIVAKANAGVAFDFPMGALGGGKIDVAKDEAVMVPLTFDAASGSKYLTAMNHTLLAVFFPYLPSAAEA